MYFNRIITMPITDSTRCRVYKDSTSFMAKTYFTEEGNPKDVVRVDDVICEISSTITIRQNLWHNEEKDVFIIRDYDSDTNYLYYLIFKPNDLQEILTLISAKSALNNKIIDIVPCEYFNCDLGNGLYIFDKYESPYRENSIALSQGFEELGAMTTGFTRNEEGLIDFKSIGTLSTQYYKKIDNCIFNKKVYNPINIFKFLSLETLEDVCNQSNYSARENYSYIDSEQDKVNYNFNDAGNLVCIAFDTTKALGFFIADCNVTQNTKTETFSFNNTRNSFLCEKELFTEHAIENIAISIEEKLTRLKNYNCLNLDLEQVISSILSNNIFCAFEV